MSEPKREKPKIRYLVAIVAAVAALVLLREALYRSLGGDKIWVFGNLCTTNFSEKGEKERGPECDSFRGEELEVMLL